MRTTFDELKRREESLLMHTYGRYPLAVNRARGATLYDFEDRPYLDLLSGIAVCSLGHCHPAVSAAVAAQAEELVHVSNLFYQEKQLDLAEALLETCAAEKVFFCNSGAEANEAAVKLARRYMREVKGREAFEVVTLQGSFHGRTLATVAATGQDAVKAGFAPLPEGFASVPFGDLDALSMAVTEKTAAVLVEIVQGEGGVRPMDESYAKGIERLCRERDILFMVDEVQTGLCRTGRFWAHQHFGLAPDVFTSAKALANGLPMGACLATAEAARGFSPGAHATTYGGGPVVCAAALATLGVMRDEHLDRRAAQLGEFAKNLFEDVGRQLPGTIREVRGLGLMLGIDLAVQAQPVWRELLDRGFVLNLTQGSVLRLLPPLTIAREDLERFAAALSEVLAARSDGAS